MSDRRERSSLSLWFFPSVTKMTKPKRIPFQQAEVSTRHATRKPPKTFAIYVLSDIFSHIHAKQKRCGAREDKEQWSAATTPLSLWFFPSVTKMTKPKRIPFQQAEVKADKMHILHQTTIPVLCAKRRKAFLKSNTLYANVQNSAELYPCMLDAMMSGFRRIPRRKPQAAQKRRVSAVRADVSDAGRSSAVHAGCIRNLDNRIVPRKTAAPVKSGGCTD